MSQRHLAVSEDDLKPPWENSGFPALSVQLKEKRDAAILEKHKEGMSNKAIAKLFNMTAMTVGRILEDISGGNKILNQENVTPEVSTSAVPMASTEDRSETREDASSFIDEQFYKLMIRPKGLTSINEMTLQA
ncbi:TPA: hypothetical protein RUX32_002835 [Aeromonas dhakensis]|nr:hypothetical protein [Aeromonas dhakensis]